MPKQLSVVSCQLSVGWLLAVGCWQGGSWQLAVGGWRLAVGKVAIGIQGEAQIIDCGSRGAGSGGRSMVLSATWQAIAG